MKKLNNLKKAASVQTLVVIILVMILVIYTFYIVLSKYDLYKSIIGL